GCGSGSGSPTRRRTTGAADRETEGRPDSHSRRRDHRGLRLGRIRRHFPATGVLVFSQYIEAHAAAELLSTAPAGVGYLLKDRVAYVSDFIDAITRVAYCGTVLPT